MSVFIDLLAHRQYQIRPFLKDPRSWINFGQLGACYLLSSLDGRVRIRGWPYALMVEPTNRCNLHCPLCPSGTGRMIRRRGTMALDVFQQVLDTMKGHVKLLQLWNQGEPLLNPDLPRMVAYAKRGGIAVSTSTNGHLLADPERAEALVASGLDHLIVSVDGATPETYVRYRRGGDLDTVLQGIRHVVSARQRRKYPTPLIELQFLVMRHNEHEMARIKEVARALSVDRLSFKTVQIDHPGQAEVFLPSDLRLSRYERIGKRLRVKQRRCFGSRVIRPYSGCRRLWYSTVVNWDGTVSPCCFDKDAAFVMGNILEEPLEDIWRGEQYGRFRSMVSQDREAVPMCRNCTEGIEQLYICVRRDTSAKEKVHGESNCEVSARGDRSGSAGIAPRHYVDCRRERRWAERHHHRGQEGRGEPLLV